MTDVAHLRHHEANASEASEIERLRSALQKLTNDVAGSWSAFEHDIRSAIGNTNYSVVALRISEADAILRAEGSK